MLRVSDEDGNTVEIDYNTLKAETGVDPFALPNGATIADPGVKALAMKGFAGGFKARGGLPGVPIDELPLLVELW